MKEGYSNIKLGMFLEIATTVGALSGATVAAHVPANGLAIVFGVVLLYSAYLHWPGVRTIQRASSRLQSPRGGAAA